MATNVLLIDYEPRAIERIRSLLSGHAYTITEAHDGEEGLSVFSSSQFDLVVLSGIIPKVSSAEVVREIRRKGGATAPPILLMVTSYRGTNPKADAQRVGAFDLLVRPFSDEAFRAAVAAAVESSAHLAARTVRIAAPHAPAPSAGLTSSDIFSEVLEEVGGEVQAPPTPRPLPTPMSPAPPRPVRDTKGDVEKRLADTLSGMLPKGPPAAERGAVPPPAAPPRYSTDEEIDKMLKDTLSGLRTPRHPPAATHGPIAPASSERAAPPGPAAVAPPKPAPAPASVSASGPDRFGQYEILERIAAGGMAELYKARRSGVEGFQKIVAIKKILPHLADNEEFITMFADEAKLAAQLNHPNIVHIFDLGKIEAGGYFIAMEFVEGRELQAILQSAREFGTPLAAPLAVHIASKVASALDYAHRRRDADGRDLNVVHRDVSPPNILISYEGDIKLCDFGIAKAASKASQTQSGALKGKVQYMSPEQAWGWPIDSRSDLFSLGAVLFEMLTEQKLFRGDTDLGVLEKVRAAQVVAPSTVNPEVPKSLDAIVLKALARDAQDRYASAADMLRDLEAVLYAYTPAPGSADLAIYLHRLQAEETAAQEARVREAANAAVREPEKKRKSKGAPVVRRAGSGPKLVPPQAAAAPEAPKAGEPAVARVFGAVSSRGAERSRAPLYGLIGVAVLALAGVAWWAVTGGSVPFLTPVVRATPSPVPLTHTAVAVAPTQVVPTPGPTPAAAAFDSKAVEIEVQRQLAAKKKELQKSLRAEGKAARRAKESAAAEPTAAPAVAGETSQAEAVKTTPPARVTPTGSPSPAPAAVPTVNQGPGEVTRGEPAGSGPGVAEPEPVTGHNGVPARM
ncbi:MAG: protein kinase domain-containing protein [Thermoanaerobaculia bacterium]